MMKKLVFLGLMISLAAPAVGQVSMRARAAALYESYSFDSGDLDKVSQLAMPIGVDVTLGSLGVLSVSGGYTTVDLTSANTGLADQSLSGMIDTEIRFTYHLIPDRLFIVGTGAVPTGINSIQTDELSVLGGLSNDLVGFSLSNLGTGG